MSQTETEKSTQKQTSLRNKILLPLAVMMLLAALVVTGVEYSDVLKNTEKRAHDKAGSVTKLVHEFVKNIKNENQLINDLKYMLNSVPELRGIHIISADDNKITFSSNPLLAGETIESLQYHPDILSEITTLIATQKAGRISSFKHKVHVDLDKFSTPATSIIDTGYIVTTLDTSAISREEYARLLQELLLTMTAALVISIAAFYLLKKHLFMPLEGLSGATEKWLRGDNDHITIPVYGQDEIGRISSALNKVFRDMDNMLASLRRSEERYGTAVKAANVAVWDWDLVDDKIYWAGWSHSFFGTDVELKLPRKIAKFYDRVHPEDRRALKKAFIAHIRKDKTFDVEFRVKLFFGGYIWVHGKAKAQIDSITGRPVRMTGSFNNITARKKAELKMEQARRDTEQALVALTESEERLALAMDGTSDGIWDWDILDETIYYSPRFRKLLGFEGDNEQAFPNKIESLKDVLHEKDKEAVERAIDSHLNNTKSLPLDIECRINIHGDGHRYFRLRGAALRNEEGKAFRMAGSLSDITQKKEDEKKLRRARKEAEEATKAKSEFLANMSHEIRTPMNGIIGTASMLKETKLDKKQKKYVDTIGMSGDVLLNILNDILDYSKIEAGKFSLTPEPFDIKRAFDDVYELFEGPADDKGLDFKINYDSDIPQYVVGDYTRIRQIVTNLTSNGIKYTEKGSVTIDVTLENTKDDITTIKMAVTDSGMGIPEDLQKTVFEKFSRVENRVSKIAGTGLGLAICTSLIDMMDGDLGLESEVGKGSTFWFSVPLPIATDEQIEETKKQDEMDTEAHFKGQILLVEDVETNQFVISDILESMGCAVDIADHGQIALDMLEEKGKGYYDLIFMDCNMPVMNGFETTEAIRKHEIFSDMPIVALTANAFKEDVDKCYACGMNGFASKPVKKKDLAKVMTEWLERDQSAKEEEASAPAEDSTTEIEETSENWDGFDGSFIEMMLGRSPEKAEKFINLTLKDAAEQMAALEKATAEQNAEEIGDSAHALKSITGQAGAAPLSDMCKELQDIGRSGNIDGVEDKVKAALAEYALFKAKLESYLS